MMMMMMMMKRGIEFHSVWQLSSSVLEAVRAIPEPGLILYSDPLASDIFVLNVMSALTDKPRYRANKT